MELTFNLKEPRSKKGMSRDLFMNSGGWFPHPELDRERFNELPAWRQKEILECQRVFREIPNVQSFEVIDPSTHKPYPNQVLAGDHTRKAPKPETLVSVPPAIKYFIPNGINLSTFRRHRLSCPESLSVTAIDTHASIPELLKSAATEDKKLTSKKPLDGIHAFVWRVAQHAAGVNRAIPITAFWDLEEGVLKLTGTLGVTDEVVKFLEHRAGELVQVTGGDRHEAETRWARFLGRAV